MRYISAAQAQSEDGIGWRTPHLCSTDLRYATWRAHLCGNGLSIRRWHRIRCAKSAFGDIEAFCRFPKLDLPTSSSLLTLDDQAWECNHAD